MTSYLEVSLKILISCITFALKFDGLKNCINVEQASNEDDVSKIRSLFSEVGKTRVFPSLVPFGSSYVVAEACARPEFEYIKEEKAESGEFLTSRILIDEKIERKRKAARERKRKSRAKFSERNGIQKSNRQWQSEDDRIRRAARSFSQRTQCEKVNCSTIPPVNALTDYTKEPECNGIYLQVRKIRITVHERIEHIPLVRGEKKNLDDLVMLRYGKDCVSKQGQGLINPTTISTRL